jgi:hypothetical protein
MTLRPEHLAGEQRKILRAVALAYRRVKRTPEEPALTRGAPTGAPIDLALSRARGITSITGPASQPLPSSTTTRKAYRPA